MFDNSTNVTIDTCSNIHMSQTESGELNVVAILRLLTSCLSIIGALSIVGSAIYRKTVCNPKVHPLFVLSIVDTMLSIMWISGAAVWLHNQGNLYGQRVGCFAINLTTVILQCVAMNVTLIYALLAYSSIKQRDFSGVYVVQQQPVSVHVWPPACSFLAYFIAWTLPVVLIMVPFGVIAQKYRIVEKANSDSCWCLPFYGNVVPRPQFGLYNNHEHSARQYLRHLYLFLTTYAAILIVNFLVVFFSMLVIYYKVLRRIKRMRQTQVHNENRPLFGATQAMILEGQKDAKKRIFLFVSIFIITGVMTFIFGIVTIIFEYHLHTVRHSKSPDRVMRKYYVLMILEALSVPVQGALNAMAYGWTRGDFLSVMSSQYYRNRHRRDSLGVSYDSMENETAEEDEEEEEEAEWAEGADVRRTGNSILFSASLRLGITPIPGGGGAGRQRGGTAHAMTPASPGLGLGDN